MLYKEVPEELKTIPNITTAALNAFKQLFNIKFKEFSIVIYGVVKMVEWVKAGINHEKIVDIMKLQFNKQMLEMESKAHIVSHKSLLESIADEHTKTIINFLEEHFSETEQRSITFELFNEELTQKELSQMYDDMHDSTDLNVIVAQLAEQGIEAEIASINGEPIESDDKEIPFS